MSLSRTAVAERGASASTTYAFLLPTMTNGRILRVSAPAGLRRLPGFRNTNTH